ncbi:CAP domain-containing protein [Deinococcus altitudinis]|uniref:CAP domain-containing protein n=1 Tax=Deinococcus altitudinis TaxID=468914 RepID=UPI0038916E7E
MPARPGPTDLPPETSERRVGGPLLWALLSTTLALAACAPPVTVRGTVQGQEVAQGLEVDSAGRGGADTTHSPPTQSPPTQPISLRVPVSSSAGAVPRVSLRTDSEMTAPLEVAFTAGPLAEGRADWQFADGGAASGGSVTHIFYRPGHYEVQATMQVNGREYRATVPLDVRSGGPEQAAAVLLQDAGSVALSAQGSVVYAAYTPRFTLDAQAATPLRQPLRPGVHGVQVSINAPSGTLNRSYSFRSRTALSAAEADTRQRYESEVLRLTNRARVGGWSCQRQAYGTAALPPLRADPALLVAARAQSVGMAVNGYFDHRSAVDGSLPDARVRASGYPATGDAENIAAGQPTPEAVVSAWLKSPGHCPNIMGDYDDIGAAYVHQDGSPMGDYWTQVFGRKWQ